ncbi:MAG: T9SS type A sorting domain-containing protein [Bacteroidales bacterium]
MRKSFFILLSVITISGSNCQDYFPMVSDSCMWYVSWCLEACGTDILYTDGDTIIHDTTYFKYFTMDTYHGNPPVLIGFLREDTLNKKVYCINICRQEKDSSEFVYYDFNLNTGDSTFVISPTTIDYRCFDSLGWYKVDSVSVVSTLTGNRKIFYLRNNSDARDYYDYPFINWIEGIGFVEAPHYFGQNWLNCFFRRGIKEYAWNPRGEDSDCDFHVDGLPGLQDEEIRIFYNRNLEQVTVLVSDPGIVKSVKIFDLNGRLVQLQTTHFNESNIHIANLNKGLYFVVVTGKNRISTSKIIKW